VRQEVEIVGDFVLRGTVVSAPFTCIGCDFRGSVIATNVSFRQRINLVGSRIEGAATFAGSTFSADALFPDTAWEGRVAFEDTEFAAEADFRDNRFFGAASFERARFRGRADFGSAHWLGGADFEAARFSDASFVRAIFDVHDFRPALDISDVEASRKLDFDSAGFGGLIEARFLTASALVLDPREAAEHVRAFEAVDVLGLIESSAKDAQNFTLANDAFYERQKILSRQYSTPRRVLDFVFYRGMAGYLVRPVHPVFALLVLVTLLAVLRVLISRRTHTPTEARRSRLQTSVGFGVDVREQIRRNILASVRWRTPVPRGVSGLEVVTYRILVVCALVGLYADPSARQIFEFLRG
jgi:hypothetical protein